MTGGAGFIGSHLYERLLDLGGSILDKQLLAKAFEDVDYVFHNAAQAGARVSIENPAKTHEINATGTLNVLNCASGRS